ncbi:MAG: hypothetical protein ACKOXG_04810 [Arenimonas sp.]
MIPDKLLFGNRVFAWLAMATGVLLLIPLIAMQFTAEVDWDATDFIVMGGLIFTAGSVFVLIARQVKEKHRLPAALLVAAGFLYVWAELAVGIFTDWGS